ncbi:MAG: hypothetical protein HPY53_16580 [Brevinematales bacterium]|nr:hypothetical protein [Brevinematales bacterium]
MKKFMLPVLLFATVFTMLSCGGGSVKPGSLPDPGYFIQYTVRESDPWLTVKYYVYHDKVKMVYSDRPGKYTLVIGDRMVDVDEKNKTYADVTAFLIDRDNPAKGLQGYLDSLIKLKAAQTAKLAGMVMYYVVSQSTIGGFLSKEYSSHDDSKTGEAKYLHLYFCDLPELKSLMDGLDKNTSGLAKALVQMRFLSHPEYGWLTGCSFVDGLTGAWGIDEFGEYPLSDASFSLDGLTESGGK